MVWAVLALLGVPLWLCVLGIASVVFRNRQLRQRYGDIPVRVRRPGKKRWIRGHAIWVSDVFAWRGSPAAWNEDLLEVDAATLRPASDDERKALHRFSDDPVIVTFATADSDPLAVAVEPGQRPAVLGPFAGAPTEHLDDNNGNRNERRTER